MYKIPFAFTLFNTGKKFILLNRPLVNIVKSGYQKINFLISHSKHVVDTQKNRLNETVF